MAYVTRGLTLHLDSDTGVTQSGGLVSNWADQAGVYGDYIQGADALKPVLTANVFGAARSGLYFDGSNDYLYSNTAISSMIAANAFEFFIVKRTTAFQAAIRGILGTNNATAGNNIRIGNNATAGTQAVYGKPTGSQVAGGVVAGGINTKAYLLNFRYDGTNLDSMDGYAKSRVGTTVACGNMSSTALAYGTYIARNETSYWNGYIGKILAYNVVLTAKERQQNFDQAIADFNIQYPALFCDPAGDNSTGLSMTTAKTTYKAMGVLATYASAYGCKIILRRAIAEDQAGSHTTFTGHTSVDPCHVMSWARPSLAATEATWVNGSNTVDLVVGISLAEYDHSDRYITAPDGLQYMIETVVDANTFLLLEKYKGVGVSGVSGAFTIQADEQYTYCQNLNAYDGADNTAAWNADAHTRFRVYSSTSADFMLTYVASTTSNIIFENIVFGDDPGVGASTELLRFSGYGEAIGCMFWRTLNWRCVDVKSSCKLRKCHIIGSNNVAHTSNFGINLATAAGYKVVLEDVGISNCYNSIRGTLATVFAKNCNFGVNGQSTSGKEISDTTTQISVNSPMFFDNCEFHPSSTEIINTTTTSSVGTSFLFALFSQNHNRVYGSHKITFTNIGSITLETGGTITLPTNNLGYVLDCLFNLGAVPIRGKQAVSGINSTHCAPKIFEDTIYTDGTARTITIDVQSPIWLNNNQIWAELEYMNSYVSTTNFTTIILRSTNTIEARSGIADWTQHLQIALPAHSVGADGKSQVRIAVFGNWYDTTNHVYINPRIAGLNQRNLGMMSFGQFMLTGKDADFAALSKVMASATNDGIAGTLPLNKVHPGNGGTMDIPAIANVRDNDTLETVTGELPSNKILKSNAIPGNWNDDNMSDNNIYAGLPFGLSETGTLAYITGTDKPRLLAAGGETVYIYGAGFTGKTGAKMGGVSGTPVTGFVVDSNSTAHFTSPSMVNGNYSLYVYGGAYCGIVQDKLFEYDDKIYSAAEEIARNTDPTEAKVVLDTEYKILGDDKLGALESVPAPAKPVITTRVWGTGKVRIDWTPCANAEEYAVERDGVPIISGLTDTCFYLDEDLPAAEYSYVVIAHNATGDTESDPSVISAMLTESEAAIWEAVVSCIGLNAGLAAVITSYWYSRINVDAPTACPLLIAYPFIGNPQGTHLELTVMFKLRVDGDDSDPEVAEVLLAQYMVLLRDAIATIPELENWLDVDISPDENVAFDIPDEDESVIEAFVEAKVSIVA